MNEAPAINAIRDSHPGKPGKRPISLVQVCAGILQPDNYV